MIVYYQFHQISLKIKTSILRSIEVCEKYKHKEKTQQN